MGLPLVCLFTTPGLSWVCRGDEIGMADTSDPCNRACFDRDPDQWDQHLRAPVQRLALLRHAHPAMRRGA